MPEDVSADDPQALFASAVAHFEAGDPAAARDVLLRLLQRVPDHPQILNYLGTTTHLTGDATAAREYFERAVDVQPDFDEAWRNLGLLTLETGDPVSATIAFTQLCELTPGDSQAHARLGDALQAQSRCADAVAAYEQALRIDPRLSDIWVKLCRALLWEGRWDAALDATARALALAPGHTGALALRSVALAELGRDAELAELVDFDRLIQACPVETPAGFVDMATFNRALSTHCLEHPSLTYNPKDNATELGYQTGNLARDADPGPVRDLLAAIGACIDDDARARPLVPGHPFLGQRPAGRFIVIRRTVLGRQKHQSSYIHRDGWLSGVHYARVPDLLRGDDGEQSAWIEFGQPRSYPKAKATPSTRRYPPTEGLLYLFPSYFYHRTIPFDTDVQRISIAFDVAPAA